MTTDQIETNILLNQSYKGHILVNDFDHGLSLLSPAGHTEPVRYSQQHGRTAYHIGMAAAAKLETAIRHYVEIRKTADRV